MKQEAAKMLNFPFDNKEIHYDPARKEISLSVENFDALVKFMQQLVERVEAAEDDAGVFRYRMREAQAVAGVLAAAFEQVKDQLRDWLGSSHSIRELATRTGIPYATCYRIVKERLERDESVDSGDLQKIAKVLQEDLQKNFAEVDDDIVLLPRPGETLREDQIYRPAADVGSADVERKRKRAKMLKELKQGKMILQRVDPLTGKIRPVEAEEVRVEPAERARRNLYNVAGQLNFSKGRKKTSPLRDLEKEKS